MPLLSSTAPQGAAMPGRSLSQEQRQIRQYGGHGCFNHRLLSLGALRPSCTSTMTHMLQCFMHIQGKLGNRSWGGRRGGKQCYGKQYIPE
eukprot:6472558-Amphidinium_carterae.2